MRRKQLLMVLLFSVLTVLCACNDGTKPEELPNDISSGEPTYGGSIVVGITQDLDSLDPHVAVAAGTDEVLFNLFEGLVKVDREGKYVAAVASDYSISEDALVYTFTLRDNVRFHNGKAVTIEDVVYSVKRYAGLLDVQDPNVVVESALLVIADVSATDEKTVVLTLSQPNTELLCYLTGAIIPCDYDGQATAPVGTGPFCFVSYAPLESLVVKRFEEYYGERAYLDQVTFKIFAGTDAAFLELMAGKIDIFPYLTEEQAAQLTGAYRIDVGSTNLVQALFLNNAKAPFDQVSVRQALCYAINRQEILDMLSGGRGALIGSSMYPGMSTYFNSELVEAYPYDTEKAKELLAQAGYPDGFSMTITVPSNYQYHMETAEILVEQLRSVGIRAQIKPVEWASWLAEVYQGREYQATIVGLDSNLAPGDILKRYRSDAKNNFINYSNEQFDAVYAAAIGSIGEADKIALYHEAQALLSRDAASVWLQDPASLTAVSKRLGGYHRYPIYAQDMASVYVIGTAEQE